MPVIMLCGVPSSVNTPEARARLYADCVASICVIEELKLSSRQITFCIPSGMIMLGRQEEIIVFVDGLFMKSERTAEVRNRLAKALGMILKETFPNMSIEVFVRPFDPAQGFWKSELK
jgi:hypothetical protein